MPPTDCHALSRREAGRGLSSVYLVHERVGIYRWTMDTRWRRRSWRGERERRAGALYRPRTALGIDERPREEYRPAFGSCTEGGARHRMRRRTYETRYPDVCHGLCHPAGRVGPGV